MQGAPVEPLRLSNAFAGEGVVLQRGVSAHVWGWGGDDACAGASALVYADGRAPVVGRFVGGTIGAWSVRFPPLPPSLVPATLVVLRAGVRGVNASSVRVGDVYIVGGQSNVCCVAASTLATAATLEPVADEPDLDIYGLQVGERDAWADAMPLEELASPPEIPWAHLGRASSANALSFSAVGWHFARALARAEPGTPIGIVVLGWAGTDIQSYSSPEGMVACGLPSFTLAHVVPRPTTLLYGHVAPFAPMALSGVAFYEGETNAMALQDATFECALKHVISTWRALANAPEMWFGIVLLAPWTPDYDEVAPSIAGVRNAQQRVALALKNVTIASAVDAGDPFGIFSSLHPRRKRIIGERLAHGSLVARGLRTDISGGPVYLRATPIVSSAGTDEVDVAVSVAFHPSTVGLNGLELSPYDAESLSSHCPADKISEHWCKWFEVRTEDGQWSNATAALSPDRAALVLSVRRPASAPQPARTPTHTRYGWGAWPVVTLYSSGLPAAPWSEAM